VVVSACRHVLTPHCTLPLMLGLDTNQLISFAAVNLSLTLCTQPSHTRCIQAMTNLLSGGCLQIASLSASCAEVETLERELSSLRDVAHQRKTLQAQIAVVRPQAEGVEQLRSQLATLQQQVQEVQELKAQIAAAGAAALAARGAGVLEADPSLATHGEDASSEASPVQLLQSRRGSGTGSTQPGAGTPPVARAVSMSGGGRVMAAAAAVEARGRASGTLPAALRSTSISTGGAARAGSSSGGMAPAGSMGGANSQVVAEGSVGPSPSRAPGSRLPPTLPPLPSEPSDIVELQSPVAPRSPFSKQQSVGREVIVQEPPVSLSISVVDPLPGVPPEVIARLQALGSESARSQAALEELRSLDKHK
jgi:hypothetical protein